MLLLRPGTVWNRLRSTYWFVPSLLTMGCVALAVLLTWVDRSYVDLPDWMGWAYGGGADGARALLSAVAGSTITVVSVTFSVMVVALTVSSQHFGPLLLSSFMRDNASQAVLGTFTGTFAYCLLVLRTVQGDGGDGYTAFVPHLAVSGSMVLTLLSVAMLIYYVHHVAVSMQVAAITARVVEDLEASIDRIYPEALGADDAPDEPPLAVPAAATSIRSCVSGYVQEVDGDALVAAAARAGTVLWLLERPGSFVVEGHPIAAVDPAPADIQQLATAVRGAFVVGGDRTSRQDVAYAAQQLVEVALRALSPGMNEPFTAMTCIDRLGQGMARLAGRRAPSARRADPEGRARVIAPPRRFDDLLVEIFEPIVRHAESEPVVLARVRSILTMLAGLVNRPSDHAAIATLIARARS